MNRNNSSSSIWQRRVLRYGLAFVAVAAGFGLRVALTLWVGPGLPTYITFYPAVMVAALLAGFGPGLLATALTGLSVAYWVLPPVGQWAITSSVDRVGLVLFAIMGLFMSAVAELYRRNRRKAAAYDQEMALRASQEALRKQVELIDPIRAEIIAREMQRVMLKRGGTGVAPVEPTGEMLRRIPATAGAALAAMGVLVLVGWVFDVAALKSVVPGLTTMKFNTALCFLLAGAALIWRDRRVLRWTCAAAVGLVAALSLAEYLTGASFGLDQLFIRDPGDSQTVAGRMAQSTAICFILAGISLLLVGARARAARWAQQAAALITGTLGLVALLGYAYEVRQFYGLAGFSSMALYTAAAFTVLGAGLLCVRTTGLVGVLMTPGPGAQLARRLLPAVILVPAIAGWLRMYGSKTGLFEPNIGTGLFAITVILVFAALIWHTARVLNRTDMARRETEAQLRNLTGVVDNSHEPLIVREPDGVIRAWNRGAEALYGWPAAEALGQRSHVLLHTESHLVEELDRQLKTTGHWEGELVHTTRDGRRVTVESRQTASRIGDGQIFILENNLDITERKRAKEALRQSEERYRMMFDTMIEGFCIIEVLFDADNRPIDYRFLEINSAFEAQTGLRNARGKRMRELAPEHEAHWFEIYGKVALTGEPARFVNEAKALNRWFDVSAYRVGEPDSHKVAILFNDITKRQRAEEALQESEERHQLATSVAKEAIWEVNLVTGTVRWNRAYAELFGRPAEAKAHGPWWLGRIHPEDRERVDASFTKVLAEGGDSWTCDYRMKLADDSYAFLNDRAIIVRDKAGTPLRAVGAKLNVTERKLAEEALASQRKELQVILESVPAMIFYKDKENHFIHTNKAFEDAMGLPKEKLHGQSLFDLYPKDMAEAYWNDDKEVMASRKSKYGIVEPMQTPHGKIILQTDKIPYFDESGNVVGVIGFAIDITERKRAEEALRESEARFRVIASNTPDHILVQDRDLRYATVINPQLGLKEEDMIGKTDHDFLSAQDADKLTQIKRQVLETGNPVHLEMPMISRTGEQQFFDGTYVPKHNAQGRIDGLIGYFRNVTERKWTEEALKFLVRCGTTSSGEGFFQELARYLGRMLGMNFVCIDRLEEGLLTARTLAVFHNGRFEDNVSYALKDTPCGDVVGQRICCFPRNVRGLFPKDEVLQDLQAESYLGTTLWNSQGKPIGLIAVIGRQPLTDTRLAESILQLVAVRAAGELERQQADEALRKLNEELEQRVAERTVEVRAASLYARSLLEASLDPLVTISPEGKITDVNQATELVTGLPREQLIGSNFSDYFMEPQKAETGYQKVLAEGAVRDYPLTIRHVSGRTTDVLYNATVYRNEAGTVQGVFAAARDITERTEAERRRDFTNSLLALFAHKTSSKEYLDSAVDVIRRWSGCQALGIRIVDGNQEIPYEASAGFEPEFLKLENRLSLERDNCCCVRAITAAFESQDRALLTPAGSFRCDDAIAFNNQIPPEKRAQNRGNCAKFGFASVAIIPIRYRDKVIGAIHLADRRPGRFPPAVAEFIESMSPLIGEAVRRFQTEAELAKHRNQLEDLVGQRTGELEAANLHLQKEIAQRADAEAALWRSAQDLERSNRDLEQFAYVASHDLQEPLRAVGGYVKLLQHRFPDKLDAKVREYITGAADGAERMQKLITDLLAFSRVGARGGAFVLADLNALLSDALNNLQVTITESGAKITSDPLPSLPVDATQIVQLFQNLIGNAIKFHSDLTPEIHVGARQEEGRWLFWVRDNGIGIEPQYAGRIFQIFQRLHTRKQYPGTGIGLAICKKIVERHGGEIRVESQPAHGSTFYFSIPEISVKMEHSA